MNIIALVYSMWIVVFCCFPATVPVTAVNFNWAPVMFVGVMVIAGIYFWTARRRYEGPVVNVSTV